MGDDAGDAASARRVLGEIFSEYAVGSRSAAQTATGQPGATSGPADPRQLRSPDYSQGAERRLSALRHGTASVANQMQIRRFLALAQDRHRAGASH
jgi:hypothetical protein